MYVLNSTLFSKLIKAEVVYLNRNLSTKIFNPTSITFHFISQNCHFYVCLLLFCHEVDEALRVNILWLNSQFDVDLYLFSNSLTTSFCLLFLCTMNHQTIGPGTHIFTYIYTGRKIQVWLNASTRSNELKSCIKLRYLL